MKNPRNLPQQLLNGALIVAVVVLLGWLSQRYSTEIDWTANQRNTLTEASRQQLASMDGPIRFVAFTYPGAEDRPYIEHQVDKYRRFHDGIELQWVDPSADPQRVREYGVTFAGQVAIEYQGRREMLGQLGEAEITGALQRLAFAGETWVVFIEGHGERGLDDTSPNGFSRFAAALRDKGLKVQAHNLIAHPRVPDNTGVLVVAAPQSALLDGETRLIAEWVAQGGNLLWLTEPDNDPGLAALADRLGVAWQPGYVIFREYQMIGTSHPGIFAALNYPPNPVTRGMDMVTLFPFARTLTADDDSEWTAQPMIVSQPSAWLETDPIGNLDIRHDEGEASGPLTVGMSLTRPAPSEGSAAEDARQQRVALVGDADFLVNGFIGEVGNQQLGLNLVQWLAERDAQLNIDVPQAPDTDISLPAWRLSLITLAFVILVPLVLLGVGVTRWMLRRRR